MNEILYYLIYSFKWKRSILSKVEKRWNYTCDPRQFEWNWLCFRLQEFLVCKTSVPEIGVKSLMKQENLLLLTIVWNKLFCCCLLKDLNNSFFLPFEPCLGKVMNYSCNFTSTERKQQIRTRLAYSTCKHVFIRG